MNSYVKETTAKVMQSLGLTQDSARRTVRTVESAAAPAIHATQIPALDDLPRRGMLGNALDSVRLSRAFVTVRQMTMRSQVEQAELIVQTTSDLVKDEIADRYLVRKAEGACRKAASSQALEQNVEAQRVVAEDEWIEARDVRIGQLHALKERGCITDDEFARRVRDTVARYDGYEQNNNQRADHNIENVIRLVGGASLSAVRSGKG